MPYFGACIHTPPPPANQILHVPRPKQGAKFRAMDTVWVSGKLQTIRNDSMIGGERLSHHRRRRHQIHRRRESSTDYNGIAMKMLWGSST